MLPAERLRPLVSKSLKYSPSRGRPIHRPIGGLFSNGLIHYTVTGQALDRLHGLVENVVGEIKEIVIRALY